MATKKIGMCCACGGYFLKSETVFVAGMEMCRTCADMVGGADDDDVNPDDGELL